MSCSLGSREREGIKHAMLAPAMLEYAASASRRSAWISFIAREIPAIGTKSATRPRARIIAARLRNCSDIIRAHLPSADGRGPGGGVRGCVGAGRSLESQQNSQFGAIDGWCGTAGASRNRADSPSIADRAALGRGDPAIHTRPQDSSSRRTSVTAETLRGSVRCDGARGPSIPASGLYVFKPDVVLLIHSIQALRARYYEAGNRRRNSIAGDPHLGCARRKQRRPDRAMQFRPAV